MPAISVIVPMRNEAKTIADCLRSLLSQSVPTSDYEVIVVDGMSDDGSAEIVLRLQTGYPNLVMLENQLCIMPSAMNIGLRHARSPIVVVAGAHTNYPSDYLEKCLLYLDKTGADVVGGPLLTTPRSTSFKARIIAVILSSQFGVGNANFRTGAKEGWVDTVPYPAYRKEIFERCGFYNEGLVRAQDCELHARIRHSGGRIYQTPELTTCYHPVSDLKQFLKKAFIDGKWQSLAAVQQPHSFTVRRFAPALFVLLLAASAALSIFISEGWLLVAGLLIAYFLAGLYFGLAQSSKADLLIRVSLPFFTLPFHICYGMGTLAGLWSAEREPACPGPASETRPLRGETGAKLG